MFNFLKPYKICTLFNIPIIINPSGYIIMIIWALSMFGGMSIYSWPMYLKVLFAMLYPVLLYSFVIAHEFGHILAAATFHLKSKDINLFFFGAYATLVDHPKTAKEHFWVGFGGPFVSLLLAIISMSLIFFLMPLGLSDKSFITELLKLSLTVNMSLFIFNMSLIIYPFDGGRVLHSIIWHFSGNKITASKIMNKIGLAFICFIFAVACLSLFISVPLFGTGISSFITLTIISVFSYLMYLAGKKDKTMHYL